MIENYYGNLVLEVAFLEEEKAWKYSHFTVYTGSAVYWPCDTHKLQFLHKKLWKEVTWGKQLVSSVSVPYSYKRPILHFPSNAVWDSQEKQCTRVYYSKTILLTLIEEREEESMHLNVAKAMQDAGEISSG